MTTPVTDDKLREAIARAWCHPQNRTKEMDADLAEAVLQEIRAAFGDQTPLEAAARIADQPTALDAAREKAICVAFLTGIIAARNVQQTEEINGPALWNKHKIELLK